MPKVTQNQKTQPDKTSSVLSRFRNSRQKIGNFVSKRSKQILAILAVLFVVVFAASKLTQKAPEQPAQTEIKPLQVKTKIVNSTTSTIQTDGIIQNLGSITLVAQTPGPIKSISVTEGKEVKKGTTITSQETGYGTGNAAYIGVQIAQKNLELADTSYKTTQDSVNKSRQIADESRTNTEELRKISQQSIDGTRKVIDTTKQVISKIEADIAATTDSTIIQGLRQQLVSYQNILVGTETQLRNLEYSTNTDKSPTKLADLSRDQVYISTQLQLDASRIGRDIAELSLKSARISASLSTVRAPFAGTIEKVYVAQGQYVSPGTPIAKITGKSKLSLSVSVSGFLASQIQENGRLTLKTESKEIQVPITHVSTAPTNGQLYEVLAQIPDSYANDVYDGQAVHIELPTLSQKMDDKEVFQIPLDSVFVSNLERYVFLNKDGVAVKKNITTRNVIGNSIEVVDGLQNGDEIILDRRIIDGQKIAPQIQEENIEERG